MGSTGALLRYPYITVVKMTNSRRRSSNMDKRGSVMGQGAGRESTVLSENHPRMSMSGEWRRRSSHLQNATSFGSDSGKDSNEGRERKKQFSYMENLNDRVSTAEKHAGHLDKDVLIARMKEERDENLTEANIDSLFHSAHDAHKHKDQYEYILRREYQRKLRKLSKVDSDSSLADHDAPMVPFVLFVLAIFCWYWLAQFFITLIIYVVTRRE